MSVRSPFPAAAFLCLTQLAHGQTAPSATAPSKQLSREAAVELLRFASTEAGRASIAFDLSELLAVAQQQAILKDVEGLTSTAERLQAIIDKAKPGDAKLFAKQAWPALAGSFAWAGQMEKARAYAAKVPADVAITNLAKMHAQLGDLAKAESLLGTLKRFDRDIAYSHVAESIAPGDRATAEKLLKKAIELSGKSPSVASLAYISIGDFKTAASLAEKNKDIYAWQMLAEEMEAHQEFELAKVAKAGFLLEQLQKPSSLQSVTLRSAFQIQWQLESKESAAATAARLVREARQAIAENTDDWENQVTAAASAAEAAAQVGDEALAKSMLDAAARIKVPADKRADATEQLEAYVATGRARHLLANGNQEDAIELADSISDSLYGEDAFSELIKDSLRRGNIDLALKIFDAIDDSSIRKGDPIEWIARAHVRMFVNGSPLAGQPVNLQDWPRSLEEPEERALAARVMVEELLRRGAVGK